MASLAPTFGRGAMTNLLLHRDLLSGLEPAFAVAFQTIDPAMAGRRRLARPRQALLFRGSGRRSLTGSDIEQVCQRIRRRRRCRETCKKDKSSEAKSQNTGHEDPRCCAPAGTTFGRDVGHNAAQIRQRDGFILHQKTRSRRECRSFISTSDASPSDMEAAKCREGEMKDNSRKVGSIRCWHV